MPTGKDSEQVAVVMSKELKERLREYAASKRWSMSQASAILIEEGLDRAKAEQSKTNQS
jgi:hypothetical protein